MKLHLAWFPVYVLPEQLPTIAETNGSLFPVMLSSSAILMLILERTKELQAACLVLKFKTTFPDSCPSEPQS